MYGNVPEAAPGAVMVAAAVISGARHAVRQAEIEQLHLAFRSQHDIARLQMPVNDAVLVRLFESGGDLDGDADQFHFGDRAAASIVGQRLPGDELHDNEIHVAVAVEVVDRRDVRMTQLRERVGFAPQPPACIGIDRRRAVDDLDGDVTAEPVVVGSIGLAHPARAETVEKTVTPESVAAERVVHTALPV